MVNEIQPMPALTAEQFAALRDDIEANGVLVPVVVDQHGRILDGNHRAAIAGELGIDYPTVTVGVADDTDAWDKAVALNCARRHMTRAEVRTVVAGEILRRPDDSDRAIAKRVGCSPSTVGTVRGRLSNLDTLRGEFDQCAEQMRVAAACKMVPLLGQPTDTSERVRVAWRHGIEDAEARIDLLGRAAVSWLRAEVWEPMDSYLADEWPADKQREVIQSGRVLSGAELVQEVDQLRDCLPLWAVILRESWPDVFTSADAWVSDRLLSNLDRR